MRNGNARARIRLRARARRARREYHHIINITCHQSPSFCENRIDIIIYKDDILMETYHAARRCGNNIIVILLQRARTSMFARDVICHTCAAGDIIFWSLIYCARDRDIWRRACARYYSTARARSMASSKNITHHSSSFLPISSYSRYIISAFPRKRSITRNHPPHEECCARLFFDDLSSI